MKKTKLLVVLLLAVISFSCSKDDDSSTPPETPPEELTLEEKLIEGSPWSFDHMEVVEIIDAGPNDITKSEIEILENYYLSSEYQISFNADGTGIDINPNFDDTPFDWEVIDGGKLKVTFGPEDIYVIDTIDVINGQLVFENEDSFDDYFEGSYYSVSYLKKSFFNKGN